MENSKFIHTAFAFMIFISFQTFSTANKDPSSSKKMRILVPDYGGFPNLLQMGVDPRTNLPNVTGFCGDVFNAAFNALNYKQDVEFIPYNEKEGTYNDLIDKVYSKEVDGAIGDITITSNRSRYIDFTLPFSDLGTATIVRNSNKSMWIFLDPLSANLWLTFATFFLVLGFVIWFIEHRTNLEFQGSTRQQIETTLWFAFSTLVYAHREKLESNLSRFVVMVWLFVVLVLTSSYTATLSSLLTVQQIALKGVSVEFGGTSLHGEAVFSNLKYDASILRQLQTPQDYLKALRSGRVITITDEIPYIKSVLALHSSPDISLVATASTTNGFGFVFQKGSPLAREMSTQIAKLREHGTLKALEDKWFKNQSSMISKDFSAESPNMLNLHRLRGLFLISAVSMAFVLLVSMVYLAREKYQGKRMMEILRCIFRRCVHIHVQDNDLEITV